MAHALNNCSHTSVCAELGITRGNDRTQTSLTRHASINKWSFYRSGSISANASTKLIELTAPSSNDKLGNFRGYNHSANTPYLFDGYSGGLYYGPGGTSFTFTTIVYLEELNVRELTSGSVPYIIIKYYPTSTDRTNGTNVIKTTSTLVSETSVTPPVGHSNNQTAKPASASQTINDTFNVVDIPAGNTVYLDVYIGNNGGSTVYGRFGSSISDSYDNVTIYENSNPTLEGGGNISSPPSGWTALWPIINSASSPICTDAILTQSNGQTTYDFYVAARGIFGVTARVLAVTSCTVYLRYGGVSYSIATSQALNGTSSKTRLQGTIPSSQNFSYNEAWTVEISVNTWGSAYTNC